MTPIRSVLAGLAVCAAVGAALRAEQPQFRGGVELVAVDVSVVSKGDGKPVSDLRAADFTLTVDGKPRRLVSAEPVSIGLRVAGRGTERPAERKTAEPTDGFSTNVKARPGRIVLLAVDQGHLSPGSGAAAAAAARRFLDQLAPNDQVGLMAFPDAGPSIEFTSDHDRVRKALPQITGRSDRFRTNRFRMSLAEAYESPEVRVGRRSPAWMDVIDRECRAVAGLDPSRATLVVDLAKCEEGLNFEAKSLIDLERRSTETTAAVLAEMMSRLGEIDGPKTVVLISEGLPAGPDLADRSERNALVAVGRAAAAARVTLYTLFLDRGFIDSFDTSPRGAPASVPAEMEVQGQGLDIVSGAARGAVFRVTAKADWVFARVLEETSAYYLLAFEPEAGDRDGKPHQIAVRVQRKDVDVRSRREFVVHPARATPKPAEDEVRALLSSPLVASVLPLRVGAFVMRDATSPSVRTLVAADIGAGVTAAAEVTLGLTVTDQAGKVIGGYVKKETLKPFGTGEAACLKFSDAILVSPGRYTLKLAVVDSGGRRGSAVREVVAEIPRAGGVETSDLLLIDPSGGGLEGGTPAVTATIAGESVGMYLEVYYPQTMPAKDARVTLEIAGAADGPALFSRPASIVARPEQRRWVATEVIDAPLLPPGDYVARAVVALDGRPAGRALRLFHLASPALAGTGAAARGSPSPRNLVVFGEGAGLVRPFKRDSVLGPDVVSYFVARMEQASAKASAQPVQAAISHARAGEFAQVLTDLSGASADQLAVPFLRGLAKLSNGELEPARMDFRDALRISSDFLPAAFYIGACYAAGGKDREAAGAWQTALVTESDVRIVFDVLADAYIRLRDAEQAEAILKEAMGKWPNDDLFVLRLAAALALGGKDGEALSVLGAYLARRPDDDQGLFLAIRLLYEALAKDRPVRSAAADRADFMRYVQLYDASSGTSKAIVARWQKYVDGLKR